MTTERELSDEHEEDVAKLYAGKRSRNSGAGTKEKGDVAALDDDTLFECKRTGRPGLMPKSKPRLVTYMEKIADEAADEGLQPALALRYYDPESPLADKFTGWIDLTVRLSDDDAYRSERLYDNQA